VFKTAAAADQTATGKLRSPYVTRDVAAVTGQLGLCEEAVDCARLFLRGLKSLAIVRSGPGNYGASAAIAGWPGTSAAGFLGRNAAGISMVSAKPTATTNTSVVGLHRQLARDPVFGSGR
jgi:hypothetical protein